MASVNSYRFLVAVLAAVAVSPSAAAGLGTEGAARPHLTLADESPLVVTGRGFRAGERVRVVAYAARGRYRKTVSVSSRGHPRLLAPGGYSAALRRRPGLERQREPERRPTVGGGPHFERTSVCLRDRAGDEE